MADDWSDVNQRMKPKATSTNKDFINNQLEHLDRHIIDNYNFDYNSKKYISNLWLR